MNRYGSGEAFRTALEDRLAARARDRQHRSPTLDRKLLVFERFLARLLVVAPDQWVLKGGVALEFRMPGIARTTRDLDLGWLAGTDAASRAVIAAADLDPGDRLRFVASRSGTGSGTGAAPVVEFRCDASMAGRRFETVRIDVGLGDALARPAAVVPGSGIMAFAGFEPVMIPVLPIEQHVAEKVHAYTVSRAVGRENTRLKDLVDLVLIASTTPMEADALALCLETVFAGRATHRLPATFPVAPAGWNTLWPNEAVAAGFDHDIGRGLALVGRLLDPVLAGMRGPYVWNPPTGEWLPATDLRGAE